VAHDAPRPAALGHRVPADPALVCRRRLRGHGVHDLRCLLCAAAGRQADPSAAILDSRTLQSTPESGPRAGDEGAKRKRGAKVHVAMDTLGHLLALKATPADKQDRAQVADLARQIQHVTGDSVELAFVDQGYTGAHAAQAGAEHGITLSVIKRPEARRGFVLLPRRWVVERSFAWLRVSGAWHVITSGCSPRMACMHLVAYTCLMLPHAVDAQEPGA
jgi:transposase